MGHLAVWEYRCTHLPFPAVALNGRTPMEKLAAILAPSAADRTIRGQQPVSGYALLNSQGGRAQ